MSTIQENAGILEYDEICRIVKPIFDSYDITRAWLFGSYARGEASAASDVDLRIEGGRIRGMFGLGRIYDDLTTALNKPVDLVTTEALEHESNKERTRTFRSRMKEDEKLIYEKAGY